MGTGSGAEESAKPAKVATGSRSFCEPHRVIIEAALVQGLSAIRIHQDLVTDHAFTGRYNTVKRFVQALATVAALPFRRIETAPGEEMQVDFGQGAPVIADGKRRRPHLFRATLSFSSKGYRVGEWGLALWTCCSKGVDANYSAEFKIFRRSINVLHGVAPRNSGNSDLSSSALSFVEG